MFLWSWLLATDEALPTTEVFLKDTLEAAQFLGLPALAVKD